MALAISGNPPAGSVGQPYSTLLVATGGTPPYTFSVISGSLPPGLTLNSSSGLISGVPTLSGSYPFTAQVADSSSSAGAPVDLLPTIAGYDFGSEDPAHCQNGFQFGGNLYVFLMQNGFGTPSGDFKLHALKSTDNGATWNEADAANAPNVGTVTAYGNCYTVCQDGAIVYALYVNATFANIDPNNPVVINGFTVIQFDLSTDLWSTSTVYVAPVIDFMRKDHAGGQSRETQVNLVRRGAGDMIFYYSGPNEVSGATGHKLARVYYATFDGTTFGAGTELPSQVGSNLYFLPTGCVCDSLGNTHFFYFDDTSGTIGFNVYHVGLDNTNAFGTTQIITNQGFLFDVTGGFSAPITFTLEGVEQVAFLGFINDDAASTTQSVRLFYAPVALNPVWVESIATQDQVHLPVPFFFYQECQLLTLGVSGGSLYAVWCWSDSTHSATANGFFYEAHAPLSSPFVWTAAAQLFASSILLYPAYQVGSFQIASLGVIGVSVHSADDSEVAQFDAISAGTASAAFVINVTAMWPRSDGGGGGWECRVSQCLPLRQSVDDKCSTWGPVSIAKSQGAFWGIYRDSLGQVRQFRINPNLDAVNQLAAAVIGFERGNVDARTNNPGRVLRGAGQIAEHQGVAVFPSLDVGINALRSTITSALTRSRREVL